MKSNESQYLTPREYATLMRIHYRTAIRQYKQGLIPGTTTPTGRIRLQNPNHTTEPKPTQQEEPKTILYARVSSTINKPSLNGQIERLQDYAAAKGYQIVGGIQGNSFWPKRQPTQTQHHLKTQRLQHTPSRAQRPTHTIRMEHHQTTTQREKHPARVY